MLNLDDLARLESAATPPGWIVVDYDDPDDGSPRRYVGMRKHPDYYHWQCDSTMLTAEDAALIVALRNAASALIATARNYEALRDAVAAVVSCTSVNAENTALEALAKVWEAQTGRVAASGQGYVKPAPRDLADVIFAALIGNEG